MLQRLRLAVIPLVFLPLTLTGCLDYAEELALQPDGSGTLTIDFTLDMSFMAEISDILGEEPNPEELRGPSKEEILEGVEVEGIEVQEIDVKHRDRKSRVHLKVAFQDLESLARIEGFGDDRQIEFFDDQGKVRMVYSFDTADVIPVDEAPPEEQPADVDPIERKILEITKRARDRLRFRGRVVLPGPVLKSNGSRDPNTPNASVWRIDKESEPQKHASLGRGKVFMMLLADKATVPFARDLKPLPEEGEGEAERGGEGEAGPPSPPRGLGD